MTATLRLGFDGAAVANGLKVIERELAKLTDEAADATRAVSQASGPAAQSDEAIAKLKEQADLHAQIARTASMKPDPSRAAQLQQEAAAIRRVAVGHQEAARAAGYYSELARRAGASNLFMGHEMQLRQVGSMLDSLSPQMLAAAKAAGGIGLAVYGAAKAIDHLADRGSVGAQRVKDHFTGIGSDIGYGFGMALDKAAEKFDWFAEKIGKGGPEKFKAKDDIEREATERSMRAASARAADEHRRAPGDSVRNFDGTIAAAERQAAIEREKDRINEIRDLPTLIKLRKELVEEGRKHAERFTNMKDSSVVEQRKYYVDMISDIDKRMIKAAKENAAERLKIAADEAKQRDELAKKTANEERERAEKALDDFRRAEQERTRIYQQEAERRREARAREIDQVIGILGGAGGGAGGGSAGQPGSGASAPGGSGGSPGRQLSRNQRNAARRQSIAAARSRGGSGDLDVNAAGQFTPLTRRGALRLTAKGAGSKRDQRDAARDLAMREKVQRDRTRQQAAEAQRQIRTREAAEARRRAEIEAALPDDGAAGGAGGPGAGGGAVGRGAWFRNPMRIGGPQAMNDADGNGGGVADLAGAAGDMGRTTGGLAGQMATYAQSVTNALAQIANTVAMHSDQIATMTATNNNIARDPRARAQGRNVG